MANRAESIASTACEPRAESRDPGPSTSRQRTATARTLLEPVPLSRVGSTNSALAGQSLRRMATHETGEYAVDDIDQSILGTHHEHHEHDHDHVRHADEREPRSGAEGERVHEQHCHKFPSDESRDPEFDSAKPDTVRKSHDVQDDTECRCTRVEVDVVGDGDGSKTKDTSAVDPKYALQDQTNLLPIKQVIVVFVGLSCALFCALLDQTIVTTALPTLGKVFNATDISSWVGTAYMLTSTSFQPLYGRLSDIFGRKVVLLANIMIFLIGSIGAACAQTMIQLIVFRSISGLGAGGILTLSLIIIADIVSLKDRGKFQGISGGVVALANSLGPVLGGIFSEIGWRWCFYINLPITGLSLVVIFFVLPLRKVTGSAKEKLKKIDYYGAVLTLVWAMLVLLALSWAGTTYSWTSAAVLAPLIIGLLLAAFWVFMEAKLIPLPLAPMYIFKNQTVSASMATTFGNGVGFFVTLYYLPQYLQVVRGETPIQAAVDMLPLTFVQVFFVFFSGFMVAKTGDYKWTLLIGFFIWTIGLGLISTVNPTTPKAHLIGYQVIIGLGAGPTFQTSLIAIQASVARQDMAIATGLRNFLRMLGGTVALAISAAIMNNIARSKLDAAFTADMVGKILQAPTELQELGLTDSQIEYVRLAYSKGINGCFWFCIPISGISFFITLFFVKRVSLKRDDEARLKEEAKAWLEERKKGSHKGEGDHSDEEKTIGTVTADMGHSGSPSVPLSERTMTAEIEQEESKGKNVEAH